MLNVMKPIKYNPSFLTDLELISSFVVRKAEFDSIIETISENTGQSNSHVLVIAPRGFGKTMLIQRVATEVRTSNELSEKW